MHALGQRRVCQSLLRVVCVMSFLPTSDQVQRLYEDEIAKIEQDILYQKRYIVGLQNPGLFFLAHEGLRHLERALFELRA